MWLCFNDAFVSLVEDDVDPTYLKVRSRRRDHLVNLFPEHAERIEQDVGTDYKYRLYLLKDYVAEVVSKRVRAIDYPNFKDSVKNHELHELYADFWHLHYAYQVGYYQSQL